MVIFNKITAAFCCGKNKGGYQNQQQFCFLTKYKQERIRKNETKTDETTPNEKTKTEPIPDEKTTFAYAEDTKNADKQPECTLSVRCDTIWNNVSKLKKEKVAIVPKDGTILTEKSVAFDDGESVLMYIPATEEKQEHEKLSKQLSNLWLNKK